MSVRFFGCIMTKNVGVGKNGQPQIWFIADGYQALELTGEKLNKMMSDVDTEVKQVYTKLHSLFRL